MARVKQPIISDLAAERMEDRKRRSEAEAAQPSMNDLLAHHRIVNDRLAADERAAELEAARQLLAEADAPKKTKKVPQAPVPPSSPKVEDEEVPPPPPTLAGATPTPWG